MHEKAQRVNLSAGNAGDSNSGDIVEILSRVPSAKALHSHVVDIDLESPSDTHREVFKYLLLGVEVLPNEIVV